MTQLLTLTPDAKEGVRLDLDALVSSRLLVQADSGGGKSRMLRYLIEQLHGRVQIIVLDPEGEFATLRERFPFLLAGKDGDVATDPKTAKVLARRLMELGASAVVDLFDLKLPQRRLFVKLFLDEIMHLPRTLWRPCLFVIDEAHVYCPQGAEAESSEAVITVATQGRKRGYCAVLATQRISKLDKDAAAEMKNRLIGSTGLDLDMKRAGDDLGFDKEQRLALRSLNHEFWAFGPAISREPVLVKAGPIVTTHPTPGTVTPPAPPAPEAVRKLLGQMRDLEHEAEVEARTIEDLTRQLAAKTAENRKLQRGVPAVAPVADTKAVERAVAAKERELRAEFAADRRGLYNANQDLARRLDRVGKVAKQLGEIVGVPMPEVPTASPDIVARKEPAVSAPRRISPPPSSSTLPEGEAAILTACCQYPDEGCTRQQLTILTGYKRSTRDAYIQRLRAKDLIEVRGDRVLAAAGAETHLDNFQPLPTGPQLRDYWLGKLPEGERAVLGVLFREYPAFVSRDEISDETGYKRSTRDAYIQRLNGRLIIELGDGVRAAPFLFAEG